ncbi:MAG: macro domain-containing protein [Dorea sp.]|nr:macro domain-containing protein [Dorea sp.]
MSGQISIRKIGITNVVADAIVNAANEGLREGSGVCGAIFREAGVREMTAACRKWNGCPTGSAVITPGFRLPAKFVIHTVGPIWRGGHRQEPELLYSAYKSSLNIAKENGCHSIAFPLISAGIYGYPKAEAWKIAIRACMDFLGEYEDYEMKILFAVLDESILKMGESALAKWEKE